MSFPRRIAKARKNAGLSQQDLAAKLGVTRGAVGQWEGGQTSPSSERLRNLAAVLGVSFEWLVEGTGGNFDAGPSLDDYEKIAVLSDVTIADEHRDNLSRSVVHTKGYRLFHRSILKKLNGSAEDFLFCIMNGNHMEPFIPEGSELIVDTRRGTFSHTGVHLLFDGTNTSIYRIQASQARIVFIPDNKHFQTIENNYKFVHILGRVVWISRPA